MLFYVSYSYLFSVIDTTTVSLGYRFVFIPQ